jgi:hypothetical protein
MKRFPASEPRKMFWSGEVGGHSTCPECGDPLASEHHTYVMATRRHGELETFLVGNNGGHFCTGCSTVVLEKGEFARAAAAGLGEAGGAEFLILGLVDLQAVPREKARVPFGTDGNPVPLVKFTNLDAPGGRRRPDGGKAGKHAKKSRMDERRP